LVGKNSGRIRSRKRTIGRTENSQTGNENPLPSNKGKGNGSVRGTHRQSSSSSSSNFSSLSNKDTLIINADISATTVRRFRRRNSNINRTRSRSRSRTRLENPPDRDASPPNNLLHSILLTFDTSLKEIEDHMEERSNYLSSDQYSLLGNHHENAGLLGNQVIVKSLGSEVLEHLEHSTLVENSEVLVQRTEAVTLFVNNANCENTTNLTTENNNEILNNSLINKAISKVIRCPSCTFENLFIDPQITELVCQLCFCPFDE